MLERPFRQVACDTGIERSVAATRRDVDAGLFHPSSPPLELALKQAVFLWPLDCFASLAMTRRDQCPCSGSVSPNVFIKSSTCCGDRYLGFNPRSSRYNFAVSS